MQTRREFLGRLGVAAVGVAGLVKLEKPGHPALGIQLYTLRDSMARDFDGTLARVAGIGYREVEFAGYFGRTPKQVRESLKRHKLTAPSVHIPLPASDDAWARSLDDARAVGHEWAVIPWLDASLRKTPEDWARFGDRLNHLGGAARNAGLRFAYHNHDFELARNGDSTYLDGLLAQTDPKNVNFEMDVYWVTKAGSDPLAYLAKYPGRFPLLHLKDATPAPELRMVDVGSGSIPFPAILAAARKQGLKHTFVEHDEPKDAFASAKASYDYLSKLKS
jgi:sugar phosphate isomerase/epimerase